VVVGIRGSDAADMEEEEEEEAVDAASRFGYLWVEMKEERRVQLQVADTTGKGMNSPQEAAEGAVATVVAFDYGRDSFSPPGHG
jgi:hypothetical protein